MITSTISRRQPKVDPASAPPLREGDRLSQPEFHRRYLAMPDGVKAELVEGIVYMPPPVGPGHGDSHYCLNTVGGVYQAATVGVQGSDNATTILGPKSEPQPDFHMRLLPESGGRVHIRAGFLAGPPELVVEVADSSKTIDLNAKRRDYRRAGVLEYLVLLVSEQTIRAFADAGEELTTDADGIYRSRVFPGLWLDPVAIIAGDTRRALRTLNKGLKSPEHTAFVKRLKAFAKAGTSTKPRGRRRT
jgi:Uma2 family endonuclease